MRDISVAELDKLIGRLEASRVKHVEASAAINGTSAKAKTDQTRMVGMAAGLWLALYELRVLRDFAASQPLPDTPVIPAPGRLRARAARDAGIHNPGSQS